ncbi:MAG TPA: hypothetical protein VMF06_11325 [Candidatus Limnocylindria bacterium]|nr:hypothetical protein [Candidatus Limnocylindria bacterium]
MKSSPKNWHGWLSAFSVVAFGIQALEGVAGEFYDFNQGNEGALRRVDVGLNLGPGSHPNAYVDAFDFPSDGEGGYAARFRTIPGQNAELAPKSYLITTNSYTRCVASMDTVTWDPALGQEVGIVIRATNLSACENDSYRFLYSDMRGTLMMSAEQRLPSGFYYYVTSEVPVGVPISPENRYRITVTAYETNFLCQMFRLPDTNNPIASLVTRDSVNIAGPVGIYAGENIDLAGPGFPADLVAGVDATLDNFGVDEPLAGSIWATTESLLPSPDAVVFEPRPRIQITVLDRETAVEPNSVLLALDGQPVASGELTITNSVTVLNSSTPYSGVTAAWTPPVDLTLGLHSVTAVYSDNAARSHTNSWNFSVDDLGTLVDGAGVDPGFNIVTAQSIQNAILPNSVITARAQLAQVPAYMRLHSTNTTAASVNYSTFHGAPTGVFGGDAEFPHAPGITALHNCALSAEAYLDLPAGLVTLGVGTIDAYELGVGTHDQFSLSSGNRLLLSSRSALGPQAVRFNVSKAGLYPFRLVWNHPRDPLSVEWYCVLSQGHTNTGGRVLLNTGDGFKACRNVLSPVPILQSASSVDGPYYAVQDVTADTAGKKFVVPFEIRDSARYFRVMASPRAEIVSVAALDEKMVVTYTIP